MRWMWGVVGLVVVVVAVAVVALSLALGQSSTAVSELELGDCFDLTTLSPGVADQAVETVERVDLIDCEEAHLTQVVLVGELNPDGDLDYPSDTVLFEQIDRRCVEASSLVGDQFGLLPVAPTEISWNRVGGRFHCLAVPFGGRAWTGTLLRSGPSG